jgi:hypothetical protein
MISKNLHLKRTEILKAKGQVTLSPADNETTTPPATDDNLNKILSTVLTKKYIGENNDENA